MPTTHDRFINNELLRFISRPQYENSCSISSLTAVFNYLYSDTLGVKTTAELAEAIGVMHPADITDGPGNPTVMKWFRQMCKHYGVSGEAGYFFQGKDLENWDDNTSIITRLKLAVHSRDQALIYDLIGHYNLIVGYFEQSKLPEDAYELDKGLQRWIVLGDHSDYNIIPEIVQKAIRALVPEDKYNHLMESVGRTPIWTRRWGSVRHDLIRESNHCVLGFHS